MSLEIGESYVLRKDWMRESMISMEGVAERESRTVTGSQRQN